MNRQLSLALAASVMLASTAGCAKSVNPSAAVARTQEAMLVAGKPIPGKFIVKMRPGQVLRMRQGSGTKAERAIDSLNIYGVEAPAGRSINELKREFGPGVEYIEPDVTITLADGLDTLTSGFTAKTEAPKETFNDPMAKDQWGIAKTQQAEAIAATKGGSKDVVVAIVDTGADLGHPDLKEKLVKGYNATGVGGLFGVGSPADDNGHGTHCAGIAAAVTNNGVGIVGMAVNCKIMPVRVLAGAGSGSLLSVAKGITWAADHGADVISLSLGGPGTMASLGEAVAHALKKNVVVVAAMGNSGHQGNPISYPAAYPGVISVGATDADDKIGMFSSFNKYCSVSAPGVKIFATTPTYDVWLTKNSGGRITKEYSFMTGTSMATPLVAGLAGLVRSKYPGMAPAQVKELLEKTADKTPDMNGENWNEKFGFGRINAYKAVTFSAR
ncbi:MAG: S8 family serine peptidase [Candidatus Sericytochromatia bacterium]|nr:S8 family serine peptidase [Candidatus Sericytochromatia bacterium]